MAQKSVGFHNRPSHEIKAAIFLQSKLLLDYSEDLLWLTKQCWYAYEFGAIFKAFSYSQDAAVLKKQQFNEFHSADLHVAIKGEKKRNEIKVNLTDT